MEAKTRHCVEIDIDEIKGINAKPPQQPNFCDCGVYLLQFIDHFFKAPDECVRSILMGESVSSWFEYSVIRTKRFEIGKLIGKLERDFNKLKCLPNVDFKKFQNDEDDDDVQMLN